MTPNTVDWSTLKTDPATAAAVDDLTAIAGGFDPQVPAVLIPVRVETRFTAVEVPDTSDPLADLLDQLADVTAVLRRLAGRSYVTELTGTVVEQKAFKETVEVPLYEAAERDLAALATELESLHHAAQQPITTGTPEQQRALTAALTSLRRDSAAAGDALAGLRSDYQRDRLGASLKNQVAVLEELTGTIRRRVEPTLRLVAELGIRTGAQVARDLGRTPIGRPLRPGLLPGPSAGSAGSQPPRRVVFDDDTSPETVGARRAVPLDRAQLVAAAEAAELIVERLTDATAGLGPDLRAAAAGITVLPGALKADLLTRLDAAAGRPGAAELRAEIAATPSDRPELDVSVPERTAGTVWTLAKATRTVHQLLVRFYPEPLAVDSHEDELTETERVDGTNFWSATSAAGDDEELRKGAWRALCIGRSTRRAAWIARATEPVATGPTRGAAQAKAITDAITALEKRLAGLDTRAVPARPRSGTRREPVVRDLQTLTDRQLTAVVRAVQNLRTAIDAAETLPGAAATAIAGRLQTQQATVTGLSTVFGNVPADWIGLLDEFARRIRALPVEPVPRPTTPEVGSRSGTWTRAASSTVLPARFAVVTVAEGKAGTVAAGRPIPADLKLGLDPSGDTFALDEDGSLVVPDSIRWMTDFDEAEAKGMALRLTLTPQQAEHGFDELLVFGLADGDAADGEARLTAMLENHHYTGDGLTLLPVGTPTNNTEDQQAGYSSTDDPDLAYPIERGPSLVTAVDDSDGSRLATALGIDAAVLSHIEGADGTDASDALLTNRALYPGTIGHALEELAPALISRDARSRLRSYALGDVSARSLLPAVRVDDQPYGLLPAVALSRFVPDLRDAGSDTASAAERARQQRFEEVLLSLLRRLHQDWSEIREGSAGRPAVRHAHSPEVGTEGFDAQQHFLGMLGLESSSVGSSYRFAVNVADRTGVRGQPDLGLSFGIPPADGSTVDTDAAFGPFALMEHLAEVFRTAFGLPADSAPRDPVTGRAATDWQPVLDLIETSRAYGLRLLTGLWPLQGVVSAAAAGSRPDTGTWIRSLLDLTLADLRARTESDLSDVGLAELLARHALLTEARQAAADGLLSRGLFDEPALALLGSSSLYQTWSNGSLSQTSAWGLLFSTVNHLVEIGGSQAAVPGDLNNRFMAEVIDANRPTRVRDHRSDVTDFSRLPADRMTVLTREHLDLCSYRLDGWLSGLAHRRLRTLRRRHPGGAQVGAYGWVEDLRPTPGAPAATGVPAALAGLPGRPLTSDPSGEGFIQTPSPTHAVTAAILRAAYRSQTAEGSFGNEMSINLSSDRVRVALSLIDGVRAGNDLGALLGYRLERFLHEYYARPDTPQVVELDSAIFPLRRAYPTVAAVDPDAGAVPEPTRYVVDGLGLVRTLLDWVFDNDPDAEGTLYETLSAHLSGHPWGTKPGALPPRTDTDRLSGVLRGIDSIADALDALADLTTSETVHQLVRGNHARAAAVLTALSEGKAIPDPEVTDTPRTGLPVSHKLILQLPVSSAEPAVPPAGWEAVPMTPRAALEPTVNAWLAALLGDPAAIRVRLRSDRPAPGAALPELSIAELGLQPLDLVALVGDGFDAAIGALTARVLDELRPTDLPPDQPGVVTSDGPQTTATDSWTIESLRAPAWGPGIRSITDVAPLLETCADLLGKSEPAIASDYAAPEFTATAGDGVDTDELSIRVQRLLDSARQAAVTLARLLAEDAALDDGVLDSDPAVWLGTIRTALPEDPAAEHPSAWLPVLDITSGTPEEVAAKLARLDGFWAVHEAWRSAAKAAQTYGIRVGLPRRYLSRLQVSTELLQSAEVAFLDLAGRCRTAEATLAAAADPKPAGAWVQAAKDLLAEGATLVPRVGLDPVRPDLQTALDTALVGSGDLDSWLEGAAAVRPGAADLTDLQVLAEALGRPALTGSVAQLPHVDGDPWLGGPLPDAAALTGRVSVVIFGADQLPSEGRTGTALLVDEWSESVPYREEITGVALHYDQPDATAPQAILVAVPPVLDSPWTLTDLAATLHDTLEIARNRLVEVEHIGFSRYGQLLPLLVGEVVPNAAGNDVAGDRVILDFHQNNP
ncbi:hypothetical protein [Microlunatus sp. Gsoil 973]|uniref:hypothetical protein n=1 Tax=Microlunatus sp. Gsoil 973 TaxID=2672569 RepID=UPI0012B46525|nr:hypothetical protein [Microlunatus sp. Gsoil 973]QGN31641.1 hypothetical protein GJV80_01015 [Microlunatus sp. Gsoil 973]